MHFNSFKMRCQTRTSFGLNYEPRKTPKHVLQCTNPSENAKTMKWKIQKGTIQDQAAIRDMILRQGMNPLDLNPTNFTIVKNEEEEQILAIGQIKRRQNPDYLEFSSVCVAQNARGQGLGSVMLDSLLKQTSPGDRIYLTAIGRAKAFYEGFGFQEVPPWDNIPWLLVFEWFVGNIVARIAENDRVLLMIKTNEF